MALMFSLSFNIEKALHELGVKASRAVTLGCVRGINKTAASEKVAISREVAADMGIKVSVVKDAIAVRKATETSLAARVVAKGARIPRIEFAARGTEPSRGRGRGVSYRGESGGRITVPHAFITTVGGQHRGVFVRVGNTRKSVGAWSKNLPIRELFGPSIAHVFGKKVPVGEARRSEVLVRNVQHEIEFALAKGA